MAEGGFRERHQSVSHYEANTNLGSFAANTGAGLATGGRRRSSVAFAGSISGAAGQQGENVLNMQDETLRKMSVAVPNLAELSTDAKAGAESERKMSFREGVRLYPKAMFFSFGLSLAVIMEGYDTWLLGNFFGMEAFAKKYGAPAGIVDGVQTYQVSATWQTAISNSTATAQILGLFFNGIISERIGYRKTMMGSAKREETQGSSNYQFLLGEIFPETELPTLNAILAAADGLFEIVTLRNDRDDYARTCDTWAKRLAVRRREATEAAGEAIVAPLPALPQIVRYPLSRGPYAFVAHRLPSAG